jgi:hypothetical protein
MQERKMNSGVESSVFRRSEECVKHDRYRKKNHTTYIDLSISDSLRLSGFYSKEA